jgi:hypothetical protein
LRYRLPDSSVDGDDHGKDSVGVSATDYHLGALSNVTLPGCGRMRRQIARSVATQTPHQTCQIMEDVLSCPQPVPICGRGQSTIFYFILFV